MCFLLVRTDSQIHANFFVNLTLPKAGEVEGVYEVEGSWSPASAEGCVVIEVPGPGRVYGRYLKSQAIEDLRNIPATLLRRRLRISGPLEPGVMSRSELVDRTVVMPDVVDPALGPRNVP